MLSGATWIEPGGRSLPPGLDDKGQCVSQDVRKTPPWVKKPETTSPETGASVEKAAPATPEAPAVDDDVTVGTGSVIALGCIAGTLLLIVIGLLFIGITVIF
jgi:hypothetical protein